MVKKGGEEFANQLWKLWGLEGNFKSYLEDRITCLLENIQIENTNAKLRAFKSLYWAPRWTSVNLAVFESKLPITLPYYDNRMCEFICTVPEKYLANRQLQIAYIKRKAPELAKITWQEQKPFNLNNYQWNKDHHRFLCQNGSCQCRNTAAKANPDRRNTLRYCSCHLGLLLISLHSSSS